MEQNRMLKRSADAAPAITVKSGKADMGKLVADFLEAVTVVHKAHLKVTGDGSYAAHKAMGEFYDEIGELADTIAESYQGATEKLLEIGTGETKTFSTAKDCVKYLNELYAKVNAAQAVCTYSEINNELDNVKTLINGTKYKLIFLK
jgi:DNA-binding ferritin-like protein